MTINQDLLNWIATEVMGWYLQDKMVMVNTGQTTCGYFNKSGLVMYQEDWRPDLPNGQIWMVVEKAREMGWFLILGYSYERGVVPVPYIAAFYNPELQKWGPQITLVDPCVAILEALRTAVEGEGDKTS
jgi:hypothetical protein